MTTIMLVAAMIPIATGEGPGASARASMAKVILGGQLLSLFLSLLITPIAYSVWDDLSRGFAWIWTRRNGKAEVGEPEKQVESATLHNGEMELVPLAAGEDAGSKLSS
jgi:HAE1 family hydrophobic/amphiphilic exporter-1